MTAPITDPNNPTSTETPPVENNLPTNQNPTNNTIAFYEQLLAESNRRADEATQRFNQMAQQIQTPAAPVEPLDLLQNPQGFLTEIRKEIRNQVAPLDEFRLEFQRQQMYDYNKSLLKTSPRYSHLWHLIEPVLNQGFASKQLLNVDTNSLMAACNYVLGNIAATNPMALQVPSNYQQNQNQSNGIVPPQIPSSSPPVPVAPSNTNTRDLTETEERIRRTTGLSKADFLKGMEGDSMSIMPAGKK